MDNENLPSASARIEELELEERRFKIEKLQEEIHHIRVQRKLYPAVVFSGLCAVVIAFVKLVLQ